MTSTHEGSSSLLGKRKKRDKGRRIWSHQEEAILISAMKEIIAEGWRSENGFRSGYLKKLEDALKLQNPSTDLRASPHINSKLTTWKKMYGSLCAILARSGVGFNLRGNYKIDCEDETWEACEKADSSVKHMRYKSWPYLDAWTEIFGKDRATGEAAEDIFEVASDMNTDEQTDAYETEFEDLSLEDLDGAEGAAESNSMPSKRAKLSVKPAKKQKATDAIAGVCEVLVEISRKADSRLASLAESLGYEARLGKALEDAFEQLADIPYLGTEERFEVCAILGGQPDKLKIFKGMPAPARPQFVAWLLQKFKI